MSDESTTLEPVENTPVSEVENTSQELSTNEENTGLETGDTGADNQESEPKEEVKETEQEQQKLLAGKFKNVEDLEKSYKEAERVFKEKAELEKQMEVYRKKEDEAKQRREIEARQNGFATVEQQEFDMSVKDHEFGLYVTALSTVNMSPEHREKATMLLTAYKESGGSRKEYLEQAMNYFNPMVISKIAQGVAEFKSEKSAEFSRSQEAKQREMYANVIETSKKDYPLLFENESISQIFADALGLTKGNLNVKLLNDNISAMRDYFIKDYESKQALKNENNSLKDSLEAPNNYSNSDGGKKWLTREEYNNLSADEESRLSDLIVEQVMLEKAGKLPRNLT